MELRHKTCRQKLTSIPSKDSLSENWQNSITGLVAKNWPAFRHLTNCQQLGSIPLQDLPTDFGQHSITRLDATIAEQDLLPKMGQHSIARPATQILAQFRHKICCQKSGSIASQDTFCILILCLCLPPASGTVADRPAGQLDIKGK